MLPRDSIMRAHAVRPCVLVFLVLMALNLCSTVALAQTPAPSSGGINLSIPFVGSEGGVSAPVKVILLVTLLTFLPAVVISCTSFTRIIVVFSFLRQALGLQSAPPNQVLIGLSLFMTMAVMSPVFGEMYDKGISPYMAGQMDEKTAFTTSAEPLRRFMFAQTRTGDLNLMLEISRSREPGDFTDLPTSVLVPAFILSELKTSFEIGFMIYIPFVVVDLVVAMVLLAMGMMVLPPVVISLPFKIMLFVVVDGWDLVVESLVKSFR